MEEYNEIKKIIDDIVSYDVNELSIELPNGTKVSMKKNSSQVKETIKENTVQIEKESREEIVVKQQEIKECYKEIKSPMVGTFYSKSSPTAEPFVQVGDKVKKGQVLCILEAMKLMNEIESEYDGEIAEICVEDDTMVEYGEVLFKIK